MNIEVTKRLEHICLRSNMDLQTIGEKFVIALSLPTMEYDFENETEWLTISFPIGVFITSLAAKP